jgi:hypothetical protein
MMKLTTHIAGLLYENECVVVPGLGGFITKINATENHPIKHQFKPPYKLIVFNPGLRSNDGVLINSVARGEGISYLEARKLVEEFATNVIRQLQAGIAIDLPGLGILSLNNINEIEFEQDTKFNYLASSFGLSAFVSPAIKRDDFQLRLKQKLSQPNLASRVNRSMKSGRRVVSRSVLAVLALFILAGIAWGIANPSLIGSYYRTYAGLFPFFYSSPNEYIASNLDNLQLKKFVGTNQPETESIDQLFTEPEQADIAMSETAAHSEIIVGDEADDQTNEELLVIEETTAAPDNILAETTPLPEEMPDTYHAVPVDQKTEAIPHICTNTGQLQSRYYIIAGAFREVGNADNLSEYLRSKGYNVGCAGQTSGGLWMISYEATSSWSYALERLTIIREEEDQHAWLFSAK